MKRRGGLGGTVIYKFRKMRILEKRGGWKETGRKRKGFLRGKSALLGERKLLGLQGES